MSSDSLFDESSISEKPLKTPEDLLEKVRRYYPNADLSMIEKAYSISEKAHSGQHRRSGEPYIFHPLSVAGILADLRLDLASIATGLLHDVVEDTTVTIEDIKAEFGDVVAQLVDGVTKISKMNFRNTHEKQGENIRKMIVAMGKDVRVLLVKLADACVEAHLAKGEDRGQHRVFGDLDGRAAIEMLLRDEPPEIGLDDDIVRRRARHPEDARVVGGFSRERGGGRQLPPFFRCDEGVFEVLEREVLEMVLAEDADAVHEAFEHVLEEAALAADLHEHLEAIERALALTDALEVVGGLLEQPHRRDDGVA